MEMSMSNNTMYVYKVLARSNIQSYLTCVGVNTRWRSQWYQVHDPNSKDFAGFFL